jgi:ElaB/YqjD/DUF883 family membrane-anchored ribosome-binding protein
LRQEADSVMRDTVTPALTDAFERAGTATRYAGEQVRSGSDHVAGNVRGRPLTSILIAAAIGFFFGRISA